jgi:hypothetical protein
VDDAIAEAWRSFQVHRQSSASTPGPGLIGARREDPELLDQAVEQTMQVGGRKPHWERAAELRKSIPEEEWAKLPVDGSEQLDHYIHGSPKRPTS